MKTEEATEKDAEEMLVDGRTAPSSGDDTRTAGTHWEETETKTEEEATGEEAVERLANPMPSTSTSTPAKKQKPRKNPNRALPTLDRYRMGSLLRYGKKLFAQGAEIDALISETIDELANRRSAREVLESQDIESEISAKRLEGAQNEITRQIENLIDRLQYLNGRRSRLLETLASQQDRMDDFVNAGIDPESFVRATDQSCPPTGILPEPRTFWLGLERTMEAAPETEADPEENENEPDEN